MAQVVSQVKRKRDDGTGYDIFQIGPDLRYTGALTSSNNNNLEEFLLLGTDRITKTQTGEGIENKIIEFRRKEDTSNYYKLEIETYPNGQGGNIYVDNSGMVHFNEIMTFDEENQAAVEDEQSGYLSYSNDAIHINPDVLIEKQELYYIDENLNIIPVSTKDTLQSFEEIDGRTVTTIKEIITNRLT